MCGSIVWEKITSHKIVLIIRNITLTLVSFPGIPVPHVTPD